MTTVASLVIEMSANVARLQKDMDSAANAVKNATERMQKAANLAAGALGAIAGGLSVAAFASWIKGAIDAGDAAGKMSAKTGVAVKDLAGLELAFKLAGVGSDGMVSSLSKLAKGISDNNIGLRALGVSTKDATGELRPTSTVLRDVADKFTGLQDGTSKTALAMEIFGKTGADLIPLLNGGSAAMDEMDAMAKKLGLSISEDAQANSEKFNDTMDMLQQGSQGVARTIAADLLPTLTNLAGSFLESMTEGDRLKNVAAFLASGLKILYTVAVGIVEIFSTVGKTIGSAAAQIVAVMSGDFALATAINKQSAADIAAGWRSTAKQVSAAWSDQENSAVTSAVAVMKSNKDLLGAEKAREEAAKASAAASQKSAAEAAKMAEEGAKLAASLLAVESGLSGDFAKKWAELNSAYKTGAINLDVLVKAQAALLAQQPMMKAAYEAAVKSSNEAAAARKKESDGIAEWFRAQEQAAAQSLASVRDRITGLRQEEQALSTSRKLNISLAEAVEMLTIARMEEEQGKFWEGSEGWKSLQKEIDARKELLGVMSTQAIRQQEESGWLEIWNSVDRTAHDTFVNIFEGGQDAFTKLRNTLKSTLLDLLYQMTVKKWVFNIAATVTGTGASIANAAGVGGGGGGMGMLSSLGSIASGTGILGAGGLGLQSGFGALINGGLSGIGAAVSGGLSAIGAGTGASIAAGLGTIAGALGPIGLGIAGAMMLMPKGDKRFGSSYRYEAENDSRINGKDFVDGGQRYGVGGQFSSFDRAGGRIIGGPNSGTDFDGKSAAQATVIDSINALYKRLGSQTSLAAFQSGFESSEKGKGFAYAGGVTNKGDVFGQGANGGGHLNRRGSMTNEQAMEAYALELKQATLQALQSATDIPKSIASMLADTDIEALSTQALDQLSAAIDKQITDVDGLREALSALPMGNLKDLSFDAASGLIAAAGGLEQLSSNLTSYNDNFYSESEKTANSTRLITEALAAVNIAMPKTREEFRAQVEAAIALGEAGAPALAALLGVNAAFAGITPVVTAVGADLKTAFESIGGMSSELSKIIMDGINNSDPAGAGQFFADTLIYGVQNALYQGFADQVTSIITDQLVSPMVTALATGASISEAISGAAIESMVAQANAAAQALNAILSDSSFQNALKQISSAVSGAVSGSIGLVQKPAYSAPSYRGGSSYSGGGGGGGGGTQDPWKSAADAIVNAIKDLKSSLLETGPDSFARLQAQYAIDVAKAKSGDLAAAENLPGLAKSVANAAKDYGQTSAEQAMLIGSLIESMSDVVKSRGFAVPGFASGGMHSGGFRVVGENGPEIEYTGPSRIYNAADTQRMLGGNNSAELVTEIRALREEVASLRYSSEATASATRQTAKTLDSAANGGQPLTTLAVS